MVAKRGLATPTLEINDRTVAYKPNSLTIKGGQGDLNVRFQTSGGGLGEEVVTEDAESKISMVKVTLLSEKDNLDFINEFIRQSRTLAGVTIRISDEGFSRSFRNMRLISDPEVGFGSEGEVELEFSGTATA